MGAGRGLPGKYDEQTAAHRAGIASWVRTSGRLWQIFGWRIIVAALLAVFLAGGGIGGYLIGRSRDVDVDALRAAAAAEGRKEGAERGTKEGYAQGYRAAQKRTYASAYAAAYREAYAGEFESAGLDPPERIRVPDPPMNGTGVR
jgi:hypothetical protein